MEYGSVGTVFINAADSVGNHDNICPLQTLAPLLIEALGKPCISGGMALIDNVRVEVQGQAQSKR